MPSVPETSAGPASQAATSDYDSFAEAYSAGNEVSLLNAFYERPATLALAGDVAGRRILDAGCGSGPLFAALRDRGAIVTGFDRSTGMLELARRRLGDGADLQVADLGRPLPFPDGAFDDVIASLVLHYLQDWTAPLAELRRVLRPGGRLIASVDHPLQGHPLLRPGADYFATYQYSFETTTPSGQSYVLTLWHRPLPAMISAFTGAGFRIAAIDEPLPAPDTPRELLPGFLQDKPPGSGFLCFLFFVLEADLLPGAAALMTRPFPAGPEREPQRLGDDTYPGNLRLVTTILARRRQSPWPWPVVGLELERQLADCGPLAVPCCDSWL